VEGEGGTRLGARRHAPIVGERFLASSAPARAARAPRQIAAQGHAGSDRE
jgi:hypothetical protein